MNVGLRAVNKTETRQEGYCYRGVFINTHFGEAVVQWYFKWANPYYRFTERGKYSLHIRLVKIPFYFIHFNQVAYSYSEFQWI